MANIVIADLRLDGSDFFMDSEGFMMDLAEDELTISRGGATPTITTSSQVCIGAGVAVVGFAVGYIKGRWF